MTSPEIAEHESSDRYLRVGASGHVVAAIYDGPIRRPHLLELAEFERGIVAREGKLTSVSVITNGGLELDLDTQRAAEAVLAEFAPTTRCLAIVFLAEGFRGAAIRTMTATIFLISRSPYRRRVFSSLADGVQWTAETDETAGSHLQSLQPWLERQLANPARPVNP